MKKMLAVILSLVIVLGNVMIPCVSYAADFGAAQTITVQIPKFKVSLNEREYDNSKALYPLLVYKDITYFPMTYHLTRELGLVSGWDPDKGLFIAQNTEDSLNPDPMNAKQSLGSKYKAVIPAYPIYINGQLIDNSKEEYPIFNFRNITYFPLTWHFAVEEFAWGHYSFDSKNGLSISNYGQPAKGIEKNNDFYLIDAGENSAIFENYWYEWLTSIDGDTISETLQSDGFEQYSFDYDSEKLSLLVDTDYEADAEGKDVSADFKLSQSEDSIKLMYQDLALVEYDAESFRLENMNVCAFMYSTETLNVFSVDVYTDNTIPAPYTPYETYVFTENKNAPGKIKALETWNNDDSFDKVYETNAAYYISTQRRHLTGRFHLGLQTIISIDKRSGKEIILNDLFEQYNSFKAIGTAKDKLCVLATYFGTAAEYINDPEYRGRIKPESDGYFLLGEDNKLIPLALYRNGDAFLSPGGKLFMYIRNQKNVFKVAEF